MRPLPLLLLSTLATAACATEPGGADYVFHSGSIVTLDEPGTVADAIAVEGERIVAVGAWDDPAFQEVVGSSTVVVDLEGKTVIPGLQDSHLHFVGLGADGYYVARFDDATSVEQIQAGLRAKLAELQADDAVDVWTYPTTGEQGPWLFGAGWNQSKLPNGRMATRQQLDEVSRDIPISLNRVYLGVAVNTRVFELQGWDFDDASTWPEWFTEDPDYFGPGDVIERDSETGLPTGVFYGAQAPSLIGAFPARDFEQRVESVQRGGEIVLSKGIVSVIDPGVQGDNAVYDSAYARGMLPIRITTYDGIWFDTPAEEMSEYFSRPEIRQRGDEWFKIRGVKIYGDGGAGSRSASVSAPFEPSDADPLGAHNYGALVQPDTAARLEQFRTVAVEHGWEIHTHSIGDVTMRQTTDGYMSVIDEIRASDPDADLRYSIIHAYMADEPPTSVIADMAEYGIIASINPGDVFVEGDSFLGNLGPERMARLLPFRTYLEGGVRMASGSDYFVAPWDPWIGIYSMRARRLQISGEVHGPDQTIPLTEALKTYTIHGAYLTHDEDIRGSLEVGKLADLVVIDADLLNVPDEELLTMGDRVLLTMVGGGIGYRAEGFSLPGR